MQKLTLNQKSNFCPKFDQKLNRKFMSDESFGLTDTGLKKISENFDPRPLLFRFSFFEKKNSRIRMVL